MDLFKDIKKGKFGHNTHLKREATHELSELGGSKIAKKFENRVKNLKASSRSRALDKLK